jgi:hypothetical protein
MGLVTLRANVSAKNLRFFLLGQRKQKMSKMSSKFFQISKTESPEILAPRHSADRHSEERHSAKGSLFSFLQSRVHTVSVHAITLNGVAPIFSLKKP